MKPALADFHAGVDRLVAFLERTEHEHELMVMLNVRRHELPDRESELLGRLIAGATNTKQYVYAVSIVSLYGLLERLVDSLVSSFVMHLGEFGEKFESLPEVVRKNHYSKSLELAEALLKDKFRTETTRERIIANLHSCFLGGSDFTLNGSAFALHRGNLNLGRITEMLAGIGTVPHIKRVVRTKTFGAVLSTLNPERNIPGLLDSDLVNLLEPIDALVERRNDVSHGALRIDQLESVELLKGRCTFVRAYGTGLYEVLLQDAMKHAAHLGAARCLGQPVQVVDNRIVCFEASGPISVGDRLFAVTPNALEPVRHSEIVRIEIDRVAHQRIEAAAPIRFGVEVGFHANPAHAYYTLSAEVL